MGQGRQNLFLGQVKQATRTATLWRSGCDGAGCLVPSSAFDGGWHRYAEGRYTPSVDASQDWKLESLTESDGWTTMVVSRALDTCDNVAKTNG